MMEMSGLQNIKFVRAFWVAVGEKIKNKFKIHNKITN